VTSPYRIKDEVSPVERASTELVYLAGDQERRVGPARAVIQLGIAGTVAGVVAATAGLPEVGAAVILGAAALGFWRWRRAADVAGLLLRVEDGALIVLSRGTKKVIARMPLADLRNVSLDTKSIRKVEPARDVVPAVQFISSQVGPEIDVARIVLETSTPTSPTIHLTEAFLAHTDSVEWIAKIRVFLRSHGWIPEDERDGPTDDDDGLDNEDDAAAIVVRPVDKDQTGGAVQRRRPSNG